MQRSAHEPPETYTAVPGHGLATLAESLSLVNLLLLPGLAFIALVVV